MFAEEQARLAAGRGETIGRQTNISIFKRAKTLVEPVVDHHPGVVDVMKR